MSPILGILASQISGRLAPTTGYVSISTTTVGAGGAANISFGSIPQVYKHLQLRLLLRVDSAGANAYLGGYLNGDGAANYARHGLVGDGSSASAGATTSAGLWAVDSSVSAASNASGIFSAFVIDILDYTNTNKNKTMRSLSGYDTNGAGQIRMQSNLWQSTSAVSSISLLSAGNFVQYSQAALYGIQG